MNVIYAVKITKEGLIDKKSMIKYSFMKSLQGLTQRRSQWVYHTKSDKNCSVSVFNLKNHLFSKGKVEIDRDGWKMVFSGASEADSSKYGVGIVMSPLWVKAFQEAGNDVEFVSDRIMKARFKRNGRFLLFLL